MKKNALIWNCFLLIAGFPLSLFCMRSTAFKRQICSSVTMSTHYACYASGRHYHTYHALIDAAVQDNAMERYYIDQVEKHKQAGLDINGRINGTTPLQYAAGWARAPMIYELIRNGALWYCNKGSEGKTPVHFLGTLNTVASEQDLHDSVQYLMNAGNSPNDLDCQERNSLFTASDNALKILLDYGADLYCVSKDGVEIAEDWKTAPYFACWVVGGLIGISAGTFSLGSFIAGVVTFYIDIGPLIYSLGSAVIAAGGFGLATIGNDGLKNNYAIKGVNPFLAAIYQKNPRRLRILYDYHRNNKNKPDKNPLRYGLNVIENLEKIARTSDEQKIFQEMREICKNA